MLVTNIFSFSDNVLKLSKDDSHHLRFSLICKCSPLDSIQNFVVLYRVTVELGLSDCMVFKPFPKKPWFLPVCSSSPVEIASTLLENFLPFLSNLKLSFANSFNL